MSTLKVQNGSGINSCTRSTGRILIGRASDCDLRLWRPDASRHHVELYDDSNGAWFLRDLGSTNGTMLNDEHVERLKPYPVVDGDSFSAAHMILYIHIDA